GDYRSMVRGPLQCAGALVDPCGPALRGELLRQQDEVDAQAPAALERIQAVIPPREFLLGLLEQPERIGEAGIEQLAERRALGRRDVNAAFPSLRVVHVAVLRRYVEVAEE